VFRRRRFFTGRPVRQIGSTGLPDISWFRPDGTEMTEADWDTGSASRSRSTSTVRASPIWIRAGTGSPTTHS
jgi:pullulanase/glycogen debranching enzyme